MGDQDRSDLPTDGSELSRRDFMKGAAAAGVVIGADEYVKPTLKMLGVSRLAAAASTPPPPPPPPHEDPKKGCTPGFWGNNSSTGEGGGVEWWDTSSDPQWGANGGSGTNPFSHGTSFTPFFTSHPLMVGATMWEAVNGGGGEQPARKAARRHLLPVGGLPEFRLRIVRHVLGRLVGDQ